MLAGKTALVTGASRGIGRAIAEEFGNQGAAVSVNYLTNEAGAARTREAVLASGQDAITVQADISDWGDATRLVERTRTDLGEIDILVNNAGIFPRHRWDDMTRDDWDQVMNVNLGGLFNMSKLVIPGMVDRGAGAVVNVSSTWALTGGTDNVAYTASKGGIIAATRQMCTEFAADGIRVNAISPGATRTEMNEELREDESYVERVRETVPAERFGTPEDIGHVAAFLASEKAAYIHGQNIVVDGGLTA